MNSKIAIPLLAAMTLGSISAAHACNLPRPYEFRGTINVGAADDIALRHRDCSLALARQPFDLKRMLAGSGLIFDDLDAPQQEEFEKSLRPFYEAQKRFFIQGAAHDEAMIGMDAFMRQDRDDALAHLQEAVRLDPESVVNRSDLEYVRSHLAPPTE